MTPNGIKRSLRSNKLSNPTQIWLYGHHAVLAAIANPKRTVIRLISLSEEQKLPEYAENRVERLSRAELDKILPPGAVHQGIAALVKPIPEMTVEDICDLSEQMDSARIILLDQVTDPHNIGAVLRSAAVFGAMAVITQIRHAPAPSGVMAKAASGALETVPLIRTVNIVRALEKLKQAGFWSLGLDANAQTSLKSVSPVVKRVLVLGAEGTGLRRLTRKTCDEFARIDSAGPLTSLNVSNATAVALYALTPTSQIK